MKYDGYGQQHHIRYENGESESDDMTEVDEYTQEYSVIFSCYGSDAFDWSRRIRDGLYGNSVKVMLGSEQVYLKTEIPPIVQTHEIINTEWVKRCDLTVTFYSYVCIKRKNVVSSIEQIKVTFEAQ